MEAKPADHEEMPLQPFPEPSDDTSAEVAQTTAPVHFEGRGLDPEIEQRHERD